MSEIVFTSEFFYCSEENVCKIGMKKKRRKCKEIPASVSKIKVAEVNPESFNDEYFWGSVVALKDKTQ